MKKLMIAAVAGVMSVGAFAEPLVYDYQATVKHTYLKEKKFSKILGTKYSDTLYIKYTKSSKLKGYLVQDVEGSLRFGDITKYDKQLGNRCFLVVQNKNAEKGYKFVRIVPGIIDVKWYDSAMSSPSTLPAQGYLYLGGEMVKNVAYVADRKTNEGYFGTQFLSGHYGSIDKYYTANYMPRQFFDFERNPTADNESSTIFKDNIEEPGKTHRADFGIDDYWFTSCYLFGRYNQPTWANSTVLGYRGSFIEEFADCWMNGAGFGKVKYTDDRRACCGQSIGGVGYTLNTLSGNLKAGLYLCTENGENTGHTVYKSLGTMGTRTGAVEDQLWLELDASNHLTMRADGWIGGYSYQKITLDGEVWNKFVDGADNTKEDKVIWDLTKLDIWADGTLDQRTSDVGYGTWSIKYVNYLNWAEKVLAAGALSEGESGIITGAAENGNWACVSPNGTSDMLTVIKACMKKLDASANLLGNPIVGNNLINEEFYKAYLMEGLKAN